MQNDNIIAFQAYSCKLLSQLISLIHGIFPKSLTSISQYTRAQGCRHMLIPKILQQNSLHEHFVEHFYWFILCPKGIHQFSPLPLQEITQVLHVIGIQVTHKIMAFIPEEWDILIEHMLLKHSQHLECKTFLTQMCQAMIRFTICSAFWKKSIHNNIFRYLQLLRRSTLYQKEEEGRTERKKERKK